ncbi:MAG: hypothetical protein HY701_03125 [Gemmatimonadetes bacterium]|nr:hypothetical protein [Gemmatimonadota bacterium]
MPDTNSREGTALARRDGEIRMGDATRSSWLVHLRPVAFGLRPALHARTGAFLLLLGGGLAGLAMSALSPPSETTQGLFLWVLLLLCGGAGILFMEGIVSGDLETGVVLLWLQKPVRPELYYLNRYVESLLAALVVVLAVASAGVALLAARSGAPVYWVLAQIPSLLLITVVYGSMTFAFSAWGVRRDGTLPVALTLFATVPAGLYAMQPDRFGTLWRILEPILPPFRPLYGLAEYLSGHASPDLTLHLVWIAAYCAAWIVAGVLGVRWTTRSPFGARA